MCAGTPWVTNNAANVSSTSVDRTRRATRIAKHSREYSSTTVRIFSGRPSCVRAVRKSYAHTWWRYAGRQRTHDPSVNQSRPRLGCFWGTFSPSRRHSRSTRLGFTSQPSPRSSPVIRRYPYRPYRVANAMIRATSRGSSSGTRRRCRCVDRAWPSTRQARRSETPSWWRTWSTACRRRGGLRSFPRSPL